MRWLNTLGIGAIMLLLTSILIAAINFEPSPSSGKVYFFQHGVAETGAINLVTAIYLGYRAFDTLGETIVLLLAVAGVIGLIGKKP